MCTGSILPLSLEAFAMTTACISEPQGVSLRSVGNTTRFVNAAASRLAGIRILVDVYQFTPRHDLT